MGVDGKPILFHQQKDEEPSVRPKRSDRKTTHAADHRDLLAGLKSLGMTSVTAAEVETALKELGIPNSALKEHGKVLKAVFLKLKRRDVSPTVPKQKPEPGEKP
jgi:hypothetical protein